MNQTEQGVIGTVRFRVTLSLVLTAVGVVFFLIFWKFPDLRVPLTYAVALVSALTVVFTAYYIATNSAISIARDKIHRSFEFTRQLNEINFVNFRTFLERELDHQRMSPSEFYKKVVENAEIHSALKSVLGTFEDASIAVQFDYVDEPALYASLSFLVPWCALSFQPYIIEQRKISSDGRLYAELDKLAIVEGSSIAKNWKTIMNNQLEARGW